MLPSPNLRLLLDHVLNWIKNYMSVYQAELRGYKTNGMSIIGYARKSKGVQKRGTKNRVRLIQKMVARLEERSLVVKIYVSPSCDAKEPLEQRDMPASRALIRKLKDVEGTMQGRKAAVVEAYLKLTCGIEDILAVLAKDEKYVCLVVLDFAGLSTDPNDVYDHTCRVQVCRPIWKK